jgi:putative flippase GtrA
MATDRRFLAWLRGTRFGRLFIDRKFFHYTWIGIFISLLNIALLWLFIDIFHWPTVFSSTLVVVLNFLLRYVLMDTFSVVG